jgi:phenylpropionate dioxygenase-like ring-hydroxylating dioxygenase large terminal subunit
MFEMFPNFWTPALPANQIGSNPVAIELAAERLVLFRNPSGNISALRDRCPHRGAALSLGRVTDKGCLACPYHGWNFDDSGNCTHVPFNDSKTVNLSRLSVASFPVRVIAGLVWVFTGVGEVPEPQVPETLMLPETSYYIHQEVWNAHWSRVVEANLDFVHLPFVHRHSFGQIAQSSLDAGKILDLQIEHTEQRIEVFTPYTNPPNFSLEWHQPNQVIMKFDDMGFPVLRQHFFAVPMNERQTKCIMILQMAEGMDAQTQQFAAQEFIKPVVEDQVVVESQQVEIPVISEECHVPTDKASLLFRRWYHQAIARQLVTTRTIAQM